MQCNLIVQRLNRKVCLKVVRKDILNEKILSAQYDGLAVDDGDKKTSHDTTNDVKRSQNSG
jgi:hypothetical protein